MSRIIITDVDPAMVRLANANGRLHWARKAIVTKYWRTRAWIAAQNAAHYEGQQRFERAHVTVTIRWPDSRKRDPNNWAPLAKAAIDGITDAGWWSDDDSRHVIGPDLRQDPDSGPYRVVIDVEEVAA